MRQTMFALALVALMLTGCRTAAAQDTEAHLSRLDTAETTIQAVGPFVDLALTHLDKAGATPEEVALVRAARADLEAATLKVIALVRLRLKAQMEAEGAPVEGSVRPELQPGSPDDGRLGVRVDVELTKDRHASVRVVADEEQRDEAAAVGVDTAADGQCRPVSPAAQLDDTFTLNPGQLVLAHAPQTTTEEGPMVHLSWQRDYDSTASDATPTLTLVVFDHASGPTLTPPKQPADTPPLLVSPRRQLPRAPRILAPPANTWDGDGQRVAYESRRL